MPAGRVRRHPRRVPTKAPAVRGLRSVQHRHPPNRNPRLLGLPNNRRGTGKALQSHVHLPDRTAISDAADLITRFGAHAADEAKVRADRSRELGNVVEFCRWRQIGRMILLLSAGRGSSTIH